MVVPKHEQSAKSHSIEIRKPFEIRQVELEPGITVWTVDSTPADCVRFAVSGLRQEFDLCVSGINRGYNIGYDIMYSGTFAAACEAAHKGMRAIALSTSIKYYDQAVNHMEEIFRFLEDNNLLQHGNLYNINIPVNPKGFRITRQGGDSFCEEFISLGNGLYAPGGCPLKADGVDKTLDTNAVRDGCISVTPMVISRTNMDVYRTLTEEVCLL